MRLRLRDLAASFGFLTKVVLLLGGGGVTAGSAVSKPRVRLVNEVVLILQARCRVSQESSVGAATRFRTFRIIFI